jgi:hypothetical protein
MELLAYFFIGFFSGAYAQHRTQWLDRMTEWMAKNL